jgi:hypothetical protein
MPGNVRTGSGKILPKKPGVIILFRQMNNMLPLPADDQIFGKPWDAPIEIELFAADLICRGR